MGKGGGRGARMGKDKSKPQLEVLLPGVLSLDKIL